MALTKLNNASVSPVTSLPNLASLPAGITTGKILQIQHFRITDTTSTSSTSYVATTLTDSITPIASGSKIYVIGMGGRNSYAGGAAEGSYGWYRQINGGGFSSIDVLQQSMVAEPGGYGKTSLALSVLDSPTYTLGQTIDYKLYFKTNANTFYLNSGNTQMSISLMELAT
jgi:hypothetical protein